MRLLGELSGQMLRISLGNQERGLADVGWSSHKRCDPQSDTNTNIRNNPLPERERERERERYWEMTKDTLFQFQQKY